MTRPAPDQQTKDTYEDICYYRPQCVPRRKREAACASGPRSSLPYGFRCWPLMRSLCAEMTPMGGIHLDRKQARARKRGLISVSF